MNGAWGTWQQNAPLNKKKSHRKNKILCYYLFMEILIIIIVLFLAYYLLRPTSKEELKRFKNKDNWSNMGF